MNTYDHFGVDFGSKLAGTTSICIQEKDGSLLFSTSIKNENADLWLEKQIIEFQPSAIFIDAPLSLPGAYFHKNADYFYRLADRQLKAMSPMFLGGLTARAIKLKSEVSVPMYETYPAGLVRELHLSSIYSKKDKSPAEFLNELQLRMALPAIRTEPISWHEMDALLAWISGQRYAEGKSLQYGTPEEGLIFI
ncbi:MAG: hypothetical protein R3275_04350 [Saprospiraceae bacterium]|nr:hypothetical protein [Saprospiraceae bacterium]